MIITLLKIFFFLRPIMFLKLPIGTIGLNLLEIFALFFSLVLILVFSIQITIRKNLSFSLIDKLILGLLFWSLAVFLIYIKNSDIRDFARFTIPFFTYIVVKNVINKRRDFIKLLNYLRFGYIFPIVISFGLIISGHSVYDINYFTNLARYTGIYPNPHTFGHCMGLFIFILFIYYSINQETWSLRQGENLKKLDLVFFGILSFLATFCLYKSYVRTVYIGIIIFIGIFLAFRKKYIFAFFSLIFFMVIIKFLPIISTLFYDVTGVLHGTRPVERIASGRPFIWSHNLEVFFNLGFDRVLGGVGFGNIGWDETVWNSHNDFLHVMMQTGVVGLFLYLLIQVAFLYRIVHLKASGKFAFLAFFIAVFAMNFASNSYVTRFGLGQMFYMIMAYVEIGES